MNSTKIDPATFPTDRITLVTWNDWTGGTTAFFGPVKLCWEDTKEEADREGLFIIEAYLNGAHWAREDFPDLAPLLS